MSSLERREIDGHVVDDRAFHPMTFAGTCLRCGRSDLAEGCEPKNRHERTDALMRRGLSTAVADDLRYADASMFADLERASDEDLARLSELHAQRADLTTHPDPRALGDRPTSEETSDV